MFFYVIVHSRLVGNFRTLVYPGEAWARIAFCGSPDHIECWRAAAGRDDPGGLRLVGRFAAFLPETLSLPLFEHEVRAPVGQRVFGSAHYLGAEGGASPPKRQPPFSRPARGYARPERIFPAS
jgi:hypothetical protein